RVGKKSKKKKKDDDDPPDPQLPCDSWFGPPTPEEFTPVANLDEKTPVVGIDPGKHHAIHAVNRDGSRRVHWSTKRFHHEAGSHQHAWQVRFWQTKHDRENKRNTFSQWQQRSTSRTSSAEDYRRHLSQTFPL